MKTGIETIAAERERQITEKGYTLTNDDQYMDFQLSDCAVSYLLEAEHGNTPIPNLAAAGALIAAEIDRLQRLERTSITDAERAWANGEHE